MLGVSPINTAEENVSAFVLMEKELLRVAHSKGFTITIAENASPLTQVGPSTRFAHSKVHLYQRRSTSYLHELVRRLLINDRSEARVLYFSINGK